MSQNILSRINRNGLYAQKVNEEVHINHDMCPAGEDTKRRLYIRRVNETRWVAYCHHCSGTGYYCVSGEERATLADLEASCKENVLEMDTGPLIEWREFKGLLTWEELSEQQKDFLHEKVGVGVLTKDLVSAFDIKYVSDEFPMPQHRGRLLLPIFVNDTTYNQFTTRKCPWDISPSPKYLTHTSTSFPYHSTSFPRMDKQRGVVITEDLLSAYKISFSNPSIRVVSTLGVRAQSPVLTKLIEQKEQGFSDRALIWYDPDPAGATGSVTLYKKLDSMGFVTAIVSPSHADKEAKYCTPSHINEVLRLYGI